MRLSIDLATKCLPKFKKGRSKPHTSPTFTGQSSREVAPTSMKSFSIVGSWFGSRRSQPITPRCPFMKITLPPMQVSVETPPMGINRAKPSSSTCVTISPISSMCAEIMMRKPLGCLLPLRAIRLPIASVRISSALPWISSKIAARISCSWPEGPGVSTIFLINANKASSCSIFFASMLICMLLLTQNFGGKPCEGVID